MVGLDAIDHKVFEDEKLQSIVYDLMENSDSHLGYELKSGRLLYKDKLVFPLGLVYISKFLTDFHASPYGGHLGYFVPSKGSWMYYFERE